ncbi:MAG: hypothetical protein EAY65_01730 [Alphaproteobacteria bacterium]|nr:MAG: hypothetical protein EAY65_01730 [Alphaproteobacteria bacterium]
MIIMALAARQLEYATEYKVLDHCHMESALHCLAEAFLDEPLLKFLNIPYQATADILRPRLHTSIEQGLSVIAVEGDRVVSTIFCDDNNEDHVPYPNEQQWEGYWQPVFDLLGKLHGESVMEQAMHAQGLKFYHLFFAGTVRDARNKGHLRQLMRMSLEVARKKGFDVAMVEASSKGTQKACRDFGYELAHTVEYKDVPTLAALHDEKIELFLLKI